MKVASAAVFTLVLYISIFQVLEYLKTGILYWKPKPVSLRDNRITFCFAFSTYLILIVFSIVLLISVMFGK